MKLNIQQKVNTALMVTLITIATAVYLFSEKNRTAANGAYLSPINAADSTFAVFVPEP